MNKTTFSRAFLLLTLILTCALTSRAGTFYITAATWGFENAAEVRSDTIPISNSVFFIITLSKGTGNYAPAYYTSDSTIRFYKGNTVTVSSNSNIKPTAFCDHQLTNGSYTFEATEKFKTVAITYSEAGDVVSNVLIDNIYYDIDGFVATVVECPSSVTELNIPSKITYAFETYSVTSIGDGAFDGCTGLISVTIPESVTSIGDCAFYGCTGLTSLTIPNSVTSIGASAFNGCTGLTSVTIPNSVTSIGDYAFGGCTGLTSLTIPNSVTSIGDVAFGGCTGLTSVTIPNTVTTIGDYTFYGCARLTSVTIPNSVTSIGDGAFNGCTGLTSVVIGNSVTSIGDYAFYGCTGLTSVVIPNSVTSIGGSAFYQCTGLTSVTIGNSVTSIGYGAFGGCTGLTSVIIPNSVTSIGDVAFDGCTGLTSVTIGNSVSSIGDGAFNGCVGLTSVSIPNSVTSIGGEAFLNCTSLQKFTVESGNTEFVADEQGALYNNDFSTLCICPGGKVEFDIPNSVTTIGDNAFGGCTGLTSVTIPNSVTSIGSSAFYGCTGLTSVTIPNSVTSIGNAAFCYCEGLTSVTIPNTVTTIGDYTFYGCARLTSVTIPNSVTSIGTSAFEGCTGLTSVTISNSVTSIGDGALYGCTGLTSVVIPNSVTSIGAEAFSGCTGLQWIESKATTPPTIAEYTFSDYSVPLIAASEDYKTVDYWKNFTNVPTAYTPTGRTFEENGLKYEIIDVNDCTCRLYGIDESVEGDVVIPATVTYREREFTPIEISGILIKGEMPITSLSIPSNISTISSGSVLDASLSKLTVNTAITNNITVRTSIDELVIAPSVNEFSNDLNSNTIGKLTIEDGKTSLTTTQLKGVIKELYLGRNVSENTFAGLTSLEKVSISDKATSIEQSTFSGCSGMSELNIAESETELTIGDKAFSNVKPTKAYIGRNISSAIFTDDTKLSDLTIGDMVTAINSSEFKGCTGLTSLQIPGSTTTIGTSAFNGCSEITELNIADSESELTIGGSAFTDVKPTKVYLGRNISDAIFTDNTNLSDLTIGGKVTAINSSEFKGCIGLTSVTIPNSVTSIGNYAFQGCAELSSVSIPETVTSLGNWTFDKCAKLKSVNIPSSVTSIGEHTFGACTGLTSVTIPNSVTSIGDYAFYGCTGVTELNIADSETKLTIGGSAFTNVKPTKAYLGRSISSAIFTGDTNLSDLTIGDKVTAINGSEFKGCTALTALTIPNSVTSIGGSAFSGCTGLTSVTIPNSVTSIGNYAFSKCTGLTSVTIGNSVTSIGSSAFYGCTGLTSVTIPNSVTSIGNYVFYGCTDISELNFVDGGTKLTIGGSAFTNVKPTKAYLGRNISSAIFTEDTNLSDLTIGDKVAAINDTEFKGCTALTALTIPNTVTSIGASAFSGCTGIAELKFEDGESELTLGDDAFKDVALKEIYFNRQMNFANAPISALETVEFGENVTSIETGAFKSAKSLLSVTSCNTVPPTTENPFNDDTYLDGTLYVPATALETYKAAAGWKNFWTVKAIDGTESSISEIGDNDNAPFTVEPGAICVDGDADVRIVSMNGTIVYSGRGETRINLTPGVYIVIINNTPTKVAVK